MIELDGMVWRYNCTANNWDLILEMVIDWLIDQLQHLNEEHQTGRKINRKNQDDEDGQTNYNKTNNWDLL